jgi:acyl-CoA synthetase (AMP-forming)/AMP-acid ligase II
LHPQLHASTSPEKAAIMMAGSGVVITFAALEARANQSAHLLRALGLNRGEVLAVFLENTPDFFDIAWAAERAGVYFVCMSSRLTAPEVEYIVRDCGARVFIASRETLATTGGNLAEQLRDLALFVIDAPQGGFRSWSAEAARLPTSPIADQSPGSTMLYSSGTTGRPKGVRAPLPEIPDLHAPSTLAQMLTDLYGLTSDTVYLCPAPLYHAAPLFYSMGVHRLGGTVVVLEKFDAEKALGAIERYRVTASQWVPTHFVRMLKLPEAVMARYDVSSMQIAIHAAAPCPIHVKEAMIGRWGPILFEYYGGTEGNGLTFITTAEWLERKGSVGRAHRCVVHVCGEDGEPLPPRTVGTVFFEGGRTFEYNNDPAKTAEARNRFGWSTLGDVGWLDEDGYLYLTDRKSFMIISGGVNIYPQEIENVMVAHPKVADVAVIGGPDEEMGERVIAVVQPLDWADATAAFSVELLHWTRERLSGVKTPRQVDFMQELPRHDNGKIYKRLLRDQYWSRPQSAERTRV